ncbi:hypothetical protein ACIU1J_27550 [Azospirillum doebereinerae]|uniref:hypothetical protein n=1 Tax=Azospirillum doebereinerae TaxID=92933 RepID=UPI001EE60A23|nr:hypothetical protein [Azospirillum doebereinerae]MCG5241376.1 hypothetical protein [Azospirillum doebereinerae]
MIAASQLSLMPAHVPAERPKSKPVESPALFNFGELDAASRHAAKDSSEITHGFRILNPDERAEAGATWAKILRTVNGKDTAKRVAAAFEKAGQPVSVRTVQNWLNGQFPAVEHIILADRLYGPGIVAEIYEPTSPAAAASRLARLKRLVDGGVA